MWDRERVGNNAARSKPATAREGARLERQKAYLGKGDDITTTERARHVLAAIDAFFVAFAEPATDAQENADD